MQMYMHMHMSQDLHVQEPSAVGPIQWSRQRFLLSPWGMAGQLSTGREPSLFLSCSSLWADAAVQYKGMYDYGRPGRRPSVRVPAWQGGATASYATLF